MIRISCLALVLAAPVALANDPGPGDVPAARAYSGDWTFGSAQDAPLPPCDLHLYDGGSYGSFDAIASTACKARFAILGRQQLWQVNGDGFELRLIEGFIPFRAVSADRFEGEYLIPIDEADPDEVERSGRFFAMTRLGNATAAAQTAVKIHAGRWKLSQTAKPSGKTCIVTLSAGGGEGPFGVTADKACKSVTPLAKDWVRWKALGLQTIGLGGENIGPFTFFEEAATPGDGKRFISSPRGGFTLEFLGP